MARAKPALERGECSCRREPVGILFLAIDISRLTKGARFLHFRGVAGIVRLPEGGLSVKVGIHPDYVDTTITCACGEVVKTRSTRSNIHVEVCSKCHPFFTGKQKLMDTAGRVERFQRKYKRQPAAAQ